jgi:hypothetical protein
MPCMGPTRRPDVAKEATNDILLLLREKYHVGDNLLDKPNGKFFFNDKYKEQLFKLVEDIIFNDDCIGF